MPTTTTVAAAPGAGLIWARVPHDEAAFAPGQRLTAVAVGGPGLVAVGNDWSSGTETPGVWTSVDGLSWTRVPHDEAAFESELRMYSVVAGGPGLVAVGARQTADSVTAAAWTSVDGIVWSRVPSDEAFSGGGDTAIHAVVAGGPGLVAVGYDASGMAFAGAVWTSVDGLVWSRIPHDEALFGGGTFINSVAVGGPGLVAVGYDGWPESFRSVVWTSVDGLVWSRVPHDEALFAGSGRSRMDSVIAAGRGLVAVGSEVTGDVDNPAWMAAVWTSVDGVVWSRVPHDAALFQDQRMYQVVAGGPGVVVIGDDLSDESLPTPTVWTSVDGVAWSRVPLDESVFRSGMSIFSLTRADSGLVGVGSDWSSGIDTTAAVWVSPPAG